MIEFENTENKVETPQNFDNSKNTLLDEAEFKDEKNIAFSCRNVDLFYDNGEKHSLVTAFIGPSGCGKSTLLRCFDRMNDLIDGCKIAGEIKYNGQDINDINTILLRTKVGMVFQQPNPFPMSIRNNICYGPKCQGIKNKEKLNQIVEQSLKDSALYDEVSDRLDASGLSLSGGQQQRLCIARTIAMSPDVILMDEPTSALDPIATLKIEELIKELKKKYTIIIVTHNMQQAARISDYTAFFMLGELVEFNRTEEFFAHPKDKRSEDYITGRFG